MEDYLGIFLGEGNGEDSEIPIAFYFILLGSDLSDLGIRKGVRDISSGKFFYYYYR